MWQPREECHERIAYWTWIRWMGGSVTTRVSGSKEKEATGNSMFDIIGVVVVVLAIFGIRRARVGIGV